MLPGSLSPSHGEGHLEESPDTLSKRFRMAEYSRLCDPGETSRRVQITVRTTGPVCSQVLHFGVVCYIIGLLCEMCLTGLCVFTLGPQQAVLFLEAADNLWDCGLAGWTGSLGMGF